MQRNPNDPRRDNAILRYDKESIAKITADSSSGTAEFYQLISMFIGIYAFMMKVIDLKLLLYIFSSIDQMGRMGQLILLLYINHEYEIGEQVSTDIHWNRYNNRVIRLVLRATTCSQIDTRHSCRMIE